MTVTALDAVALSSAAAWAVLLFLRGRFWAFREEEPPEIGLPAPSVCAVVPARNEAAVVGRAVGSLSAQPYPGDFSIILVDDNSDDGTADVARAAVFQERNLTIIPGQPLPAGWTGKLWALEQGVRVAPPCDYLLFTDADIVHAPGNLSGLAARAQSGGYDLVSYMAMLRCQSLAERALIPAFVFFFFMLYPPAWIRDPRRRTAGAAGGCILIRRDALERAGGIAAIAGDLIDDCALARRVKQSGGSVWLGLSRSAVSIRDYPTFRSVGAMIARTAFHQLGYSPLLLAGTILGLSLVFLAPPVLSFAGSWIAPAAWLMMSICYASALRFYGLGVWRAPLLPLSAVFYMGSTLASAVQHWRGRGGRWKGRTRSKSIGI